MNFLEAPNDMMFQNRAHDGYQSDFPSQPWPIDGISENSFLRQPGEQQLPRNGPNPGRGGKGSNKGGGKGKQNGMEDDMYGNMGRMPQGGGNMGGMMMGGGFDPMAAGGAPALDMTLGSNSPPPLEWANTTTVMMRNLPNKYTQRMLLTEINHSGFLGTFDFLYLPIDPETNANRGYTFLNFIDPSFAWMFKLSYEGRKMHRFNSNKVVSVVAATLQGFEANYAHYSTARVNRGDPAARPLFLREPKADDRGGKGGGNPGMQDGQKRMGKNNDNRPKRENGGQPNVINPPQNRPGGYPGMNSGGPGGGGDGGAPGPQQGGPRGGGGGGGGAGPNGPMVPKFCPHCGYGIQPGFQFCPQCGANTDFSAMLQGGP